MNLKKKRLLATFICIYFIFTSIFSLAYIIKEAHHDCTGDECAICTHIHNAEEMLKLPSFADIALKNTPPLFWVFLASVLIVQFIILFETPVTRKIRMNN